MYAFEMHACNMYTCYGSMKVIPLSYSNEDTKDEEEERLGRRKTTKCGAKRQARICPEDHATTSP